MNILATRVLLFSGDLPTAFVNLCLPCSISPLLRNCNTASLCNNTLCFSVHSSTNPQASIFYSSQQLQLTLTGSFSRYIWKLQDFYFFQMLRHKKSSLTWIIHFYQNTCYYELALKECKKVLMFYQWVHVVTEQPQHYMMHLQNPSKSSLPLSDSSTCSHIEKTILGNMLHILEFLCLFSPEDFWKPSILSSWARTTFEGNM